MVGSSDLSESAEKTIPRLSPEMVAALERPASGVDSAQQEAALFAQDLDAESIEKEAKRNSHKRNERFKDHFENIAIASLWIVASLFIVVGVVWFWHLLTPQWLHFLGSEEIDKLQNIVTGGVITGIGADHIKRRIG